MVQANAPAFDAARFPTLLHIARLVMTAPVEKLRADRFEVPLAVFHKGYCEAHDWCRVADRPFLASRIDQMNFIWRGMAIVAESRKVE